MSPAVLASAREDLREFFLLEIAARRSAQFTAPQRQAVQAYCEAAKRRLGAARNLREPNDTPGGLLLYREALSCLARAVLVSEDAHIDAARLAPEVAWEHLERVLQDHGRTPPADIDFAGRAFSSVDPLAFDRLTPEEAASTVEALDRTARWLSSLVEPRSPELLRRTRTVRLASGTAIAVGLLATLVLSLFAPKNIALDKPVVASPPGYYTTAAGAVDGEQNGRFGFHSQELDSPFLTIDLEKRYIVKTIKVFGRGDCCFDQSIPLVVELSDDGVSFRRLAERTIPFSESDPWVVKAGGASTRFVRVRSEKRGVLVLSEVEVYGKREK